MLLICRVDGTPIEIAEDMNNVDTDRFTVGWFVHEIDNLASSVKLREDIINTLNQTSEDNLSKYYILGGELFERSGWIRRKEAIYE